MQELVGVEGIALDHQRHHARLAARLVLLAGLPEGRLTDCNGRALRFWPAHPSLARHHQKELARRRLMFAHTPIRLQAHAAYLHIATSDSRNAVDRHAHAAKLSDRPPMVRAKAVESHVVSPFSLLTRDPTIQPTIRPQAYRWRGQSPPSGRHRAESGVARFPTDRHPRLQQRIPPIARGDFSELPRPRPPDLRCQR